MIKGNENLISENEKNENTMMIEKVEKDNKLYQISLEQNDDEVLSEISEKMEKIQSENSLEIKDISNKYKTQEQLTEE